ncbi:hypothetical protein K469DRAFT_687516 [Zopfia rhizophila CBS 207.26]|uniref:Uncharacterized protein n=1 Tax=Zopfia rhizophila CBS 207.26 TaxID=1314779 RepID=A0A6A6E531_9PEZI|nr:hypothetical protein K469DRAFT_687516 [Zopfia rhizophila CBS 207.26]
MSSLPSSSDVYIGHWVNWAKGPVHGSTITMNSTTGAVIVAFLALYVQISGVYLWGLLCYIFYHRRISRGLHSGLYLQQQALLRNGESPLSVSFGFLRLGWSWKLHADRALVRNLFPFFLGVLYALSIIVAAIVSSFVVNTNSLEVLVRSSSCGFWNTIKRTQTSTKISTNGWIAQNARWTQMLTSSATYSRACYNITNQTPMPQCEVYSNPSIPWASDYNATCPFSNNVCVGGQTAALQFDTGIIDTALYGINARSKDRVGLRKVTTCAPLPPDRYTRVYNVTEIPGTADSPLPKELGIWLDFGKSYLGYPSTWILSSYAINRTKLYSIVSMRSYVNGGKFSDFEAIPELHRDDGDTTIFMVSSNNMNFAYSVDDPVFSAHLPRRVNNSYTDNIEYKTDYWAGLIGCVEQYQFCDISSPTSNRSCTPLAGIMPTYKASKEIDLNPLQTITVDLLYDIMFNWYTSIAMVAYQTPPNLLALRHVEAGRQLSMSNNQWQLELQDWHGTVLSGIQQYLVSHATGPTDVSWAKYFRTPNTTAGQQLCHAQKVRISGKYANISVFGLASITVFGGVCILASLVCKHVGVWVHRKRPDACEGKSVPWIQDELLQIQRAAYQARGLGSWKGEGDAVPVTEKAEVFASHWVVDLEAKPKDEGKLSSGPTSSGH